MIVRKLATGVLCLAFSSTAFLAAGAAHDKKTIPTTITTQKGKTYNAARLVRAEPDGLVIEYRPAKPGVGMAKLKFRDLPEDLRQEFNYSEREANDFETATRNATAEALRRATESETAEAGRAETSAAPMEAQAMAGAPVGPEAYPMFPTGRFRATGTIRGAMILDSITGEAWLIDLHSVLNDYQDRTYFLAPKTPLPDPAQSAGIVIGP